MKWSTNPDISVVVSVNNAEETIFEDVPMENIARLIIQVEDAGATTCTLKLYGSFDGTDYFQIYTWIGTANIHEGTAAAATQTSSLTVPVVVYTDKVFPRMKFTAERASAGAANVTVKTKTVRW
jgi:hypothetical protein